MRRSEFLKLTELSPDQLKTLERHGSLPFVRDDTGGWSEYSLQDVIATVLATQLAKSMPQALASSLVRQIKDSDLGKLRYVSDRAPTLYAAQFGPNEDDLKSWQIAIVLNYGCVSEDVTLREHFGRTDLRRAIAIMWPLIVEIEERAKRHKIPIDFDEIFQPSKGSGKPKQEAKR